MERKTFDILIIEDDPHTRTTLKLILTYRLSTKEKLVFREASTAGDAWTQIHSIKPDLILLDIMVPGSGNDLTILAKLKSSDELKTIPVIVVSAKAEELSFAARELGAYEVVKKPWDIAVLIEAIAKALSVSHSTKPIASALVNQAFPSLEEYSSAQLIELLGSSASVFDTGELVVELAKRRHLGEPLFTDTPAQDAFWGAVYHSLIGSSTIHTIERWKRNSALALIFTYGEPAQNILLMRIASKSIGDTEFREYALIALGLNHYLNSIPILTEALRDTDINIRSAAVEALGEIRSIHAVSDIKALLEREENGYVKIKAFQALAQIGGEESINLLRQFLNAPDQASRIDVITIFTRNASHMDVHRISLFLVERAKVETSEKVLRELFNSLAVLRSEAGLAFLQTIVEDEGSGMQKLALQAFNNPPLPPSFN